MKFSCVIPVYNAATYLKQSLPAVRAGLPPDSELVVVDDASTDESVAIAKQYADHVEVLDRNQGHPHARNIGRKIATGDIYVATDADVLLPENAFRLIGSYFETHPEVSAITGLLSKEHPNRNFFSQYKNLYMHYTFQNLPTDVSFLYGSIHAVRKVDLPEYDLEVGRTDDTCLGQRMAKEGKLIRFLKNLEVIHLKKYSLFSILRNDFTIPFDWTRVFVKHKGWRQWGKHGMGFAHASRGQLVSIALSGAILLAMLTLSFSAPALQVFNGVGMLVLLWVTTNRKFFMFLSREKGSFFCLKSIVWTWIDQTVMGFGILTGFLSLLMQGKFLAPGKRRVCDIE